MLRLRANSTPSRNPTRQQPLPSVGSRANPSTFHWQAVLVLLPVLFLVALALVSLRQDRRLADQEARERADILAGQLAERFHRLLVDPDRPLPSTTGVDPIAYPNRPAFQIDSSGALVFPPSVPALTEPTPLELDGLGPQATALWQNASAAAAPRERVALWRQLLDVSLPDRLAASAGYQLGSALLDAGSPNEAAATLTHLADHDPDVRSEAGVPFAALARFRLVEPPLADLLDPDALDRLRTQHASNLVFAPSPLTPLLLDRLRQSLSVSTIAPPDAASVAPNPAQAGPLPKATDSKPTDRWLALWREHEIARALFCSLQSQRATFLHRASPSRAVTATTSSLPTPTTLIPPLGWAKTPGATVEPSIAPSTNAASSTTPTTWASHESIPDGDAAWLVLRLPGDGPWFVAKPAVEIVRSFAGLLRELHPPEYLGVHVEIAGRRFGPSFPITLASRTVGREVSDPTGPPEVRVTAQLASADLLYARVRQRTRWLGGLVVAAAAVAGFGLGAAHRAFRRQLHLSEMKSNFVSSVSHELRAPIASVRLLAESLERGRVADPSRQREYFHLIGRECRRLSALIENVLDFSRIDQGRKRYEFEPTDLTALLDQTVRLMEPYAVEREVRLAGPDSSPATPFVLVADGRALQQALVNLIDNAVKHSPPNTTVTVAWETRSARPGVLTPAASEEPAPSAAAAGVRISVTDQGPGIPAADRERIFEPFYRRGSELRRETSGVGIGLTLVRHIVEAHQGRVWVESDEGRGSRFLMELPLTPSSQSQDTPMP